MFGPFVKFPIVESEFGFDYRAYLEDLVRDSCERKKYTCALTYRSLPCLTMNWPGVRYQGRTRVCYMVHLLSNFFIPSTDYSHHNKDEDILWYLQQICVCRVGVKLVDHNKII